MMWILIALAVLGAVLLVVMRKRPSEPEHHPRSAARPTLAQPPGEQQQRIVDTPHAEQARVLTPVAAQVAARPLPPELIGFQLQGAEALAPERRAELSAELQRIPRPPQSLHQLVSPEFIATASSSAMSELVMGEPRIAAKVLATVNSPLYGLQKTVTSIGQSITFLGMNSVRGIALQYMLNESFQANSPEARRMFEQLWTASAVASELCTRLAKQLALPDAGSLVTKLVLSSLGHMAVASLAQGRGRPEMTDLSLPLPQRYLAQQTELGLCAPGMGLMLMREWVLPESIVEGVSQMERLLCDPPDPSNDPVAVARQAVAYLSARLGERLACGALEDLSEFDCAHDASPDLYHWQHLLQLPQLASLPALLAAPDNVTSVAAFLASRRSAD